MSELIRSVIVREIRILRGMRKIPSAQLGRLSVEAYKALAKLPHGVYLDHVRSRYNVGAILRSCDAFLVQKVYLGGTTPVPPHPEIHRTALGAEQSVEWMHVTSGLGFLQQLRARGYVLIAVEHTTESVALEDFSFPAPPWVWIFGNELTGVSEEVLEVCTHAVEIPQYGTKHSLNIAVAAGIVLYESLLRLRGLGL
ncbi:MAG: TrmH family RNA methyltransferase [Bacteroidia bacterium]